MSWNYRIFKEIEDNSDISLTKEEINAGQRIEEEVYTIREVHYNNNGSLKLYSAEPYWPIGNTQRELLDNIIDMQNAFTRPVLTIEDFK